LKFQEDYGVHKAGVTFKLKFLECELLICLDTGISQAQSPERAIKTPLSFKAESWISVLTMPLVMKKSLDCRESAIRWHIFTTGTGKENYAKCIR